MPNFLVTIEETQIQLVTATIEANTVEEARALAEEDMENNNIEDLRDHGDNGDYAKADVQSRYWNVESVERTE